MDLVPSEPHALHGMTIDISDEGPVGQPAAAAAIDLTADSSGEEEEEEEEETLAQRVQGRSGRAHAANGSSYGG